MSNNRVVTSAQLQTSKPVTPFFRRRIVIYPALAVLGLLGIAWFDGGEEPLRPIVQNVESPAMNGSGA